MAEFEMEVREFISAIEKDMAQQNAARNFMHSSTIPKYSYNFFLARTPDHPVPTRHGCDARVDLANQARPHY